MSNLQTLRYFPDTGRSIKIDWDTGEVAEYQNMDIKINSTITTPEQRAARKKYFEELQKRELNRELIYTELRKLGNFYFISVGQSIDDISPEAATRLIYLGTYLPHGNNTLMNAKHKPLLVGDLPKVMNLSRQTVNRFIMETSAYITVNKDNTLTLDRNKFIRGRLPDTITECFQRVYIKNVQGLYKNISSGNHRQLGYIFKMLPYLNTEYNILCWNPDENELDNIIPLSLKEFCEECGYNYNQISRLRKIYAGITFDVKGTKENFCSFVHNGLDINDAKIFVNPHIIYRGTNYERVKVLGHFCKAD